MHKPNRIKKLRLNSRKIFWLRALMNVKMINAVMSLFYLHRGLELSDIFYISLLWSIANLLFEVPSSYLADRWGRKPTIITGVVFGGLYWVSYIFADSFGIFALGAVFYGISTALLSGTDEALVYDSHKEAGEESSSLKKLGNYHAAQKVFKIFAPIIGVLLAHDLAEGQFVLILCIDILATLLALGIALTLVEANHKMDVKKSEAGVMKDAWKLLSQNPDLRRGMFGKILPFIATLVTWHYYQAFFTDLGVPLLLVGIGWGSASFIIFFSHLYIEKITRGRNLRILIDMCNFVTLLFLSVFLCFWFGLPQPYILYGLYLAFIIVENIRMPLYSEFFNKHSHSYNRATTLSLSNFLKSAVDVPLMLLTGMVIGLNIIYPYFIALTLCIVTIVFFRLGKVKLETNTSA